MESVNIELEAAKADAANIKAEFAKLKEDEALRICAKNAQDEADSRAAKMAADELIARARIASEDVLRHAEEGAGVIIERARNEALSFRNEIFTAAKDMIATIAEELQRSVEMCMTNFVSSIKTARTDSRRTPGASSRSDDELGRRIERMQSDLDRAIADKLAEFDRKHGSFR